MEQSLPICMRERPARDPQVAREGKNNIWHRLEICSSVIVSARKTEELHNIGHMVDKI